MGSKPTVTVVPDPDALADAAARLIAEAAADAIEARGRFMWALAGGETPRATYARLALPPFRERVDWRRVWVFFGDERAVPPDHPDSNYRVAHETPLGKGPIPAAQGLRGRGGAAGLGRDAASGGGAAGPRRARLASRPRRRRAARRGRARVAAVAADEPFSLVIFGASGDLTRRKLMPALWSLYAGRVLPEPFTIIATARTGMTDDEFRVRTRAAIGEFARVQPPSEAVWERFATALVYVAGDPADVGLYPRTERALREAEPAGPGAATRLSYCAPPPSLYDDIIVNLGRSGLARPATGGFTRIIVEKPFGRDSASARALGRQLASAGPTH